MIHHRTHEQIKLFDLFKLMTLLVLIILLIPLWLFGPGASPSISSDVPTDQAADTPQIAQPESGVTTIVETETIAPATEAIAPAPEEVATKGGEAEATATEIKVMAPTLDLPGGLLVPGQVALTGTGEPGSTVEVVVDGQRVSQATVGNDGKWALAVELPEAREYRVSVQDVDASGIVLAESEMVRLTVVAPAAEVTEEAASVEAGTAEAGRQVTAPTLDPPSGSLTAGQIEMTGAGDPGSEVEVVVDGQVVGKTTVDPDGKWTISVTLPEAGDYEIKVQVVDAGGNVMAVSEATVIALVAPAPTEEAAAEVTAPPAVPATPTPTEPGGQPYVVQGGDWLSKLALKFYGDMFAYPIIFEATNLKAEEDSSFATLFDPDLIEIGQKLWIPDETE
jgi:hypothetical protein